MEMSATASRRSSHSLQCLNRASFFFNSAYDAVIDGVTAGQRSPDDDAAEPQPTDAARLKERQEKEKDRKQSSDAPEPVADPPSNNGLLEG